MFERNQIFRPSAVQNKGDFVVRDGITLKGRDFINNGTATQAATQASTQAATQAATQTATQAATPAVIQAVIQAATCARQQCMSELHTVEGYRGLQF